MFERWFIHHKFPKNINTTPSNWKKLPLKDVVQISKGKTPASQENPEGRYPFFTSSIDSPKKIDSYSYDTTAILVTSAEHFVAKYFSGKFEASYGSYIIKANNENLFIFLLEKLNNFLPTLVKQSSTTSYPQLRKSTLEKQEIVIPPDNLLNLFNQFAEPIQKHIDSLSKQIDTFQVVKKELIERIYSQNLKIS
ncbi:hypothetical protein A6V39_01790 [Candidatus Mycoplasma haematobovis]|uniref:Type I restriction modification DNA specificity domain-containing protein n=1 Tax=Candidatus Mycoplasma haematobovis TaxID=432608 RepID=A0A1A9QFM9_9MOLU|nr:restriction endonuclease subunit S [Candidatus Mycoplasma haematobovis]OAL10775.1 hypothetical protein A6V39_01790 [Candidatus Mycoplasma haematobovis]